MRFDINNYKGKYAMHCKTEEEAKEFCDYLHSIGRKWSHDVSYKATTCWHKDTKEICYNFNEGVYYHKDYYEKAGYTILEWSDFTTEFTKADLKDGMVVEYRNGSKRIVLNNNIMSDDCFIPFAQMNDNLTHYNNNDYDIIKAYRSSGCTLSNYRNNNFLTLIWERKEKPEPEEMTLEEVCKALGKEIKIVKG